MAEYIEWLRERVGQDPIFLNATAALIINEKSEFLLQRRGRGERKDAWSFPGGIMEIGEFAQDTVKREVKSDGYSSICIQDTWRPAKILW